MKKMKKIFALLIAMVMVLGMSTSVFAAASDNGSITVENAAKGATYKAYKVFEATPNETNTAVTYKVDATNTALLNALKADDSPFKVSDVATDRKYTVDKASDSVTGEAIATWLKTNVSLLGDPVATGVYQESDGTVLFDKLAYGYYYITSTLGGAVSVDTNSPNVTIKDKNPTKPDSPDKKVNGAETDDEQVGKTQTYTITYNATNWVTSGTGNNVTTKQVTLYTITDTYTNLRINDQSKIQVKVNGTVVTPKSVTVTPNTDEATGGKLVIELTWADENGNSTYSYAEGATSIPVELTYEAEVTAKALNTANNTVSITNDGGADPITDSTTTTTYNLTLKKTDENGAALAGAKFELKDSTGTAISFVKTAKGDSTTAAAENATEWDYRVADSKDATATITTTIESDADGNVEIKGLDKATYTLTETEAPVGYNKAEDKTVEVGTVAEITVENKQGAELPSTGGIGTTIFYIIGAILVIGAGVVLVTRRRMNAQ